eukprot:CAMPEP_0197026272 /NCGR_PEP_ID=MMETSP1384-20130603/6396_1 /TAXON_ID=29189 /ORGANISM="Ammonia sp." /LENGTH=586 /DNA_ID=CAMNT_0042454913 /DNA_START=65 /DNA_END=1822 /DNA_ORIENTATION=+
MSVQVDSNRRHHWRMQNYVFDIAAGKYVLQQRCNIAAMDTLTNTVRSMKQYHYVTDRDDVDTKTCHSLNIASQQNQQRRGESRSAERSNRFQSNSKANKKKNWLQTKSKPKRPAAANVASDRKHTHLNVAIPANTGYVTLSQYHVSLIVSNWYRVYYQRSATRSLAFGTRLRVNPFIISALKAYTVQRFEFDEHHPLVQTWINYNIPMDEEVSTPVATSNDEEDEEDEESLSVSHDSFSLPANSVSYSLFSQTSVSSGLHSRSNSTAYTKKKPPAQQQQHKVCSKGNKHELNNWECSASLGSIKWSTIFLGNVLHSQLLHRQVYVCNVSVDKLGYGLGIAVCGQRGDAHCNHLFYDHTKLSKRIQEQYNGYADTMKDCFVLYDDGEFCDWNMRDEASKSNINQLEPTRNSQAHVRLISKLSRYALKSSKAKQLSLSPAAASSGNDEKTEHDANQQKALRAKSKKDFFANARRKKQKRGAALKAETDGFEPESKCAPNSTANAKRNRNVYAVQGKRAKHKPSRKMNEKFGFDENDVIQIAVDFAHRRITVHNINNHKCVVLSGFDYDCIRIAFVLRFSTVTVLDQKW